MVHPYLAICHMFPVFSFYLPHCDLLDFQIQNISLIVSKAMNRCTFLIEGNPNIASPNMLFEDHHKWIPRCCSWPNFCYIPLPTLHSNQTMVPSIFQAHHDPYCCCTFAHGVPSASVSPPLFYFYQTFTQFGGPNLSYFDSSPSLFIHIF